MVILLVCRWGDDINQPWYIGAVSTGWATEATAGPVIDETMAVLAVIDEAEVVGWGWAAWPGQYTVTGTTLLDKVPM